MAGLKENPLLLSSTNFPIRSNGKRFKKEFAGTINESNGSEIYDGSRVLNSKNLNALDGIAHGDDISLHTVFPHIVSSLE